jgi:hypothetical protein
MIKLTLFSFRQQEVSHIILQSFCDWPCRENECCVEDFHYAAILKVNNDEFAYLWHQYPVQYPRACRTLFYPAVKLNLQEQLTRSTCLVYGELLRLILTFRTLGGVEASRKNGTREKTRSRTAAPSPRLKTRLGHNLHATFAHIAPSDAPRNLHKRNAWRIERERASTAQMLPARHAGRLTSLQASVIISKAAAGQLAGAGGRRLPPPNRIWR